MQAMTACSRGAVGMLITARPVAIILVAMGLAATGCVSTQLDNRYQEIRGQLNRAGGTPDSRADDDLFRDATVLERAQLVREVLDRNPTIRSAQHAWRAAVERYPQVTSLDDPTLSYGLAPRSFGSRTVDDAHKFDLSQRLPFPGKLALRGETALAEAEAAGHDHAAVKLRLGTIASLLFDQYYLVQRSIEINAQHVELLEEFKRIAEARYEAGQASQQDPLQAEVELAHLVHRDVVLRTEFTVTRQQINTLLHRHPERLLPPPPQRLEPPPFAGADESTAKAQALERSPELSAAVARIHSREASVRLAVREFFPDFTVVGSHNSLWQRSDLQPFVGLSINVPLRLERRRAALGEARARLAAAESRRASIEDEVRLSVQGAEDRLLEARHVLRLFRDRLLPAASDRVGAARAGFETGRNGFLELIDSERDLRMVELGLEEAIASVSRRTAEFQRATGQMPGDF